MELSKVKSSVVTALTGHDLPNHLSFGCYNWN